MDIYAYRKQIFNQTIFFLVKLKISHASRKSSDFIPENRSIYPQAKSVKGLKAAMMSTADVAILPNEGKRLHGK